MNSLPLFFKYTGPAGIPPYVSEVSFRWALPGKNTPGEWCSVVGRPVVCEWGLHLVPLDFVFYHEGRYLYEAEADPDLPRDWDEEAPDKIAFTKARLTRRVVTWEPASVADFLERLAGIYQTWLDAHGVLRYFLHEGFDHLFSSAVYQLRLTLGNTGEIRNPAYGTDIFPPTYSLPMRVLGWSILYTQLKYPEYLYWWEAPAHFGRLLCDHVGDSELRHQVAVAFLECLGYDTGEFNEQVSRLSGWWSVQ
ncbi:MAG TPA: hypothetical protein PKD55_00105 [Bellilinea sp.]|nr:hypothetical protein [Bellilinea sp.]